MSREDTMSLASKRYEVKDILAAQEFLPQPQMDGWLAGRSANT